MTQVIRVVLAGILFVVLSSALLPVSVVLRYALNEFDHYYLACNCDHDVVRCVSGKDSKYLERYLCNRTPRILDLSWNKIDTITSNDTFERNYQKTPFGLESCSKLESLQLRGNALRDFMWKPFKCHVLKTLDLSRNRIQDGWFGEFMALRFLNLSHNSFSNIPHSVAQLTKLEYFDVSYNDINFLQIPVFQNMEHLKLLNASNNHIQRLEKEVFQNLKSLTVFDISVNELTHLPSLCSANKLELLNISRNYVHILSTQNFYCLRNLVTLDLSYNQIISFPLGIFQETDSLKYLYLSHNEILSEDITNTKLASLQLIDLSFNNITKIDGNIFSSTRNLKTINLSHNKLSQYVAKSFSDLEKLEVLDLSYNKLLFLPSNGFNSTQNLKLLDLSHNLVTSLGEALNGLITLKELDLSWNFIDILHDFTFISVPKLEKLDLSMNVLRQLPDEESKALRELKYLNISANQLTVLPLRWLQNSHHLTEIYFQDNELEPSAFHAKREPSNFYMKMEWAMYWPTIYLSPILWVLILAIMVAVSSIGCGKSSSRYPQLAHEFGIQEM